MPLSRALSSPSPPAADMMSGAKASDKSSTRLPLPRSCHRRAVAAVVPLVGSVIALSAVPQHTDRLLANQLLDRLLAFGICRERFWFRWLKYSLRMVLGAMWAHSGVRWIAGGWLAFTAENLILSENRSQVPHAP